MLPTRLISLLVATLATTATARNCKCGFSVNSTSDPQYQILTEYLETDFTQNNNDGWIPQAWSINKTQARGPYGKSASLSNVVLTAEGMQLWVRKAVDGVVDTAEVDSARTDMLYGSFRMRAKMGTANGTCGSMFWYHNNTQEIDMEFLSKQFNESDGSNINLVIQSPESEAAGFNAMYTPGFARPHLPFRPDFGFHDYRFDWTPSQVAFYTDNKLLHVMTESIPDSGGHMVFNHWSNGDPGWSAGPPSEDTYIVISHAHFYFNSSDVSRQQSFEKSCPTLDTTQVCQIDDMNITHNLMPPLGAQGSSSNPYSPGSTGPDSTSTSTYTPVPCVHPYSCTDPEPDSAFSTEKQKTTTVYAIIGVVIGLIIMGFIGCMMTIRHWVALRDRIAKSMGGCMGRGRARRSFEGHELKEGMRLASKTPDTELESQISPLKPHT